MVAALFAVHPVNVESVAWIAERKNLLSMLFFLLALWSYAWYARRPGVGRYAAVAGFFALGLMAKPQIITLPFVLLLWDYWPLRRMFGGEQDDGLKRSFSYLVVEKIPLFLLSMGSAIVTMRAQRAGGAVRSALEFSLPVRLENAIVSYARYVGKAFWPSRLAPLYPHPGNSLAGWQVAGAGLVLAAVTVAVLAARRERYLAVGWFWFLGTLVPMIGLVQVGEAAMADRYAYLPFIGLFLMVCWGVADFALRRKLPAKVLAVAAIGVLCALGVVAHIQLGYWGDNVTLWSHTVEVTGQNFVAQDNLGGALLLRGNLDEAMPHFRMAAQINPQDPLSALNIANYELQQGRVQPAIDLFQQVLRVTANAGLQSNALTGMGWAYRHEGKDHEAEQSYQEALRLVPENARAWMGSGLVAEKSGDLGRAASCFSRAAEIQPTDVSYLLLAQALEKTGQLAEARSALQTAQKISADWGAAQQETERLLSQ